MGFKQREKKRKATAAMGSAQKVARSSGSCSGKWWLTGGEHGHLLREVLGCFAGGSGDGLSAHAPRGVVCAVRGSGEAVLPAFDEVGARAQAVAKGWPFLTMFLVRGGAEFCPERAQTFGGSWNSKPR